MVSARLAAASEQGELSGTLARGLRILEKLIAALRPLTLAEVAADAGLDQSTAHRLLRTLEESGYVVRHEKRKYSPSPRLLKPLPLFNPLDQFRTEGRGIVDSLAQTLGQTVITALFIGTARMVLDMALAPKSVMPYYDTWLTGPLHATGAGKALLLSMTEKQRDDALGDAPFQQFTESTIVDRKKLDADLAQAQSTGFVVARSEYRPDVSNIAAPIKAWSGVTIGCLNVTALSASLDEMGVAQTGGHLVRAADLLKYQAPSLEAVSRFCGRS